MSSWPLVYKHAGQIKRIMIMSKMKMNWVFKLPARGPRKEPGRGAEIGALSLTLPQEAFGTTYSSTDTILIPARKDVTAVTRTAVGRRGAGRKGMRTTAERTGCERHSAPFSPLELKNP